MVANASVVLLEDLNLRNGRRSKMLDLTAAIVEPPELVLTMDGACTLTLVVNDGNRTLIASPLIREKSWSDVLGVRLELVAVSKSGDRVTLTYEDGVTAALRRRDGKMVIPAGKMTRSGIALRFAKEAGVPADVEPQHRKPVRRAVKRTGGVDSWDLLGDLAEEVHLRRFSTGTRLVFGSDDWLMDRTKGVSLVENQGAVRNIDFDLDQGKRASIARVQIDSTFGALPPGQLVILGDDMGPAAGRWLVREFRRKLTSTQADITLTRARHVLAEPKAAARGESGERDFLPGVGDGSDAGGTTATAARAKMVSFALAQNGKPYVWGASGPSSYDCSGLVQAATAAAGHTLPKPSASQAAAVAGAGKGMSIDQAIRTRGALLFRIGGEFNHVVISLGNGSTIEAMGSAYGVCIGGTSGRGWTSAGWWV